MLKKLGKPQLNSVLTPTKCFDNQDIFLFVLSKYERG
jgi:hypothetical protein